MKIYHQSALQGPTSNEPVAQDFSLVAENEAEKLLFKRIRDACREGFAFVVTPDAPKINKPAIRLVAARPVLRMFQGGVTTKKLDEYWRY